MRLAGDPRRQVRQQVKRGAADILDGQRAAQGRMGALEIIHGARVADAGARQRANRAGGNGVDANIARAEVGGQIAHARFQRRLGEAHDVVIGHDARRAAIGQRQQRAAAVHHRGGALGDLGEGEAGDDHGAREILARGHVDVAALQFVLVGEADRVNDEINRSPSFFQRGENRVDGGDVLHVAGQHERRAKAFGQRLDALAEGLALISEGEFGALRRQCPRDAPGDRVIVRDAHHEPAFSLHDQSGHRRVSSKSRVVGRPVLLARRAGAPEVTKC